MANKEENKEIFGKIKFNNEIKEILFTPTFEEFKKKICLILKIDEELVTALKFHYNDSDDDKIFVQNQEDYNILSMDISKDVEYLNIEIEDNKFINVDMCTKSLLEFDEKAKEHNLEKFSDSPKIKDEPKKDIKNDNFFNNNIKKIDINNNNEDNNNNNNEKNPFFIIQNNNDDNKPQINDNYFKNDNFNSKLMEEKNIVFYDSCSSCGQCPIVKVLYYCPLCLMYFCEMCEEKVVGEHRHSVLKVQNKEQYNDLNLKLMQIQKENKNENENKEQGRLANLFGQIKNIKNKITNVIWKKNEEQNNVQNNIMMPQYMSKIQIAKSRYDLKGISDQKLLEALEKTNGDIDSAIIYLTS